MKTTPHPGQWLQRSETRTERNGTRVVTHYRRRVLDITGRRVRLSGIERCETPEGADPRDWQSFGMLLAGPAEVEADKLQAILQAQGWRLSRAAR